MKKWISAFFLLLAFLKIGGFIAVLSMERELIRENVIRKISRHIEDKDLICIVGTPANLADMEWEKEGKEFWINEQLYDVVRTETKQGLIHYYCLSDDEESFVVARMEALSGAYPAENGVIKGILYFVFQPVVLVTDIKYEFNPSFSISSRFTDCSVSSYHFLYFSKLLEPPKFF
ncbi:MAG: hypothetical protein U0X91_07410 [Spirosomataceae bacterium]